MEFENIKNISVTDESSWKDKVFLTFDLDWAIDEVIEYTLKIVEDAGIKATFFCTHKTDILNRIRKNLKIELGIHPDFNPLLLGQGRALRDMREVIKHYKSIIPEAVSVRSHSLTYNSVLLNMLGESGLKYECSVFIPFDSGIKLKPWIHVNKTLTMSPHFWEDNTYFSCGLSKKAGVYLRGNGLKIFDFHPIHIFLNTESKERYNECKKYSSDFKKLSAFRNFKQYGTRDFLTKLIRMVK